MQTKILLFIQFISFYFIGNSIEQEQPCELLNTVKITNLLLDDYWLTATVLTSNVTYIHIAGGVISETGDYAFDPSSGQVSETNAHLLEEKYGGEFVSLSNIGYYIGGFVGGNPTDHVEKIDTIHYTFTSSTPMIYERSYFVAGVIGSTIVACGGLGNNFVCLDSCEIYSDGQWSNASYHLPTPSYGLSGSVSTDSIFYVVIGVNVYKLISNNFTFGGVVNYPAYFGGSVVFNNIIYVIGGYLQFQYLNNTATGLFSNKIQMFNLTTDTATTLNETLPVGLAKFAIATVNSRIYIFGGSSSSALATGGVYSICLDNVPPTTAPYNDVSATTTNAPSIDQRANLAGLLTFSLVVIALFCIVIMVLYFKNRGNQGRKREQI